MCYKGTRWFKCDFHLHTSASKCFEDEKKDAGAFIEKVASEGIDCIAITDHNTAESIDSIKEAAAEKGITVFPGVEVTCTDAKIHILILFDTTKSKQDVEDFLLQKLDLDRSKFGQVDAHIDKTVYDVVKAASDAGAIVIPAHIDEYNGISLVANEPRKQLFGSGLINAVQIVHQELLSVPDDKSAIVDNLKEYYQDETIDAETVKAWSSCAAHIDAFAKLTFSDNPLDDKSPKHGLKGIGKRYSWIKMKSCPNLESLRQAFLVPKLRVKNCFENPNIPFDLPKTWIKSITISGTTITEKDNAITFAFSPQLNTIIGGRGSGKSSILRFIRGLFGKNEDLESLPNLQTEFNDFYKMEDRSKKGVFCQLSTITAEIFKNNILYKVQASNIATPEHQSITIAKLNKETNTYEAIDNDEFLKLFEFDIYSQKQIYEIAQTPNSLRNRIDSAIPDCSPLQEEKAELQTSYLRTCSQIRESQLKLAGKKKLNAELSEIEAQIKSFEESGVESLLADRQRFSADNEILESVKTTLAEKNELVENFINTFLDYSLSSDGFSDNYKQDIDSLISTVSEGMQKVASDSKMLTTSLQQISAKFTEDLLKTEWQTANNANIAGIQEKKKELGEKGIANIENFEGLLEERENKQAAISALEKESEILSHLLKDKDKISSELVQNATKLCSARRDFLRGILEGQNVQISVKPFRDKQDYNAQIRKTIQKEHEFEQSIEYLVNKCFSGKLPDKLTEIHADLVNLRNDIDVDGYDGHFKRFIKGVDDAIFDKLLMLLPEDEVYAQYKPAGTTAFKNISNASAGQKTCSILTYILSHGNEPLILDQPEDDLDNHLVYGLIVDRLRKCKENRQLIIVTHNANIPVNGDSEYIIAMDSESKYLKITHEGTIEENHVKKEICAVMEGGEDAFKLRSQRYELINQKE